MDTAFKRPGRFDRVIFVSPPDEFSRAEIFRLGLKSLPAASDIDLKALATQTPNFSGANIRGLLDTAAEAVLEEVLQSGTERNITAGDLKIALRKTRPSTLEWLETAKNYVEFGNSSGQYDELKSYLETVFKKKRIGF